MLSRQFVREHPEEVRRAIEAKGVEVDVERILEVDAAWRELKAEGDDLRHRRNEVSSRIGELKREGDEEAAAEAIERSQQVKEELEAVETRADELEGELEERLLELPNVPHAEAPVGDDESDNVEVDRWGFDDRRGLPDEVVPHYDLGEDLEILDFERGAKVAGGGFYVAKGEGARLEHALVQFMLDLHREAHGYTDVFPPVPRIDAESTGIGGNTSVYPWASRWVSSMNWTSACSSRAPSPLAT